MLLTSWYDPPLLRLLYFQVNIDVCLFLAVLPPIDLYQQQQ